jgi:hypothetical protein
MNTPNPRIDYDRYLSYLRHSDETVEELLSGGADVDDLIAAGILEADDETLNAAEPDLPIDFSQFDPSLMPDF